MGDRCYLHVTMADADMARFGGLVGREGDCWWDEELERVSERVRTVGVIEANWGWINPLQEAAGKGIVFLGGHDEGCSYGAHAFVGIDCEYHEVPVAHSGDFALEVDSRLRVDPESIAGLRRYIEMRAKARAALGIDEEPRTEAGKAGWKALDGGRAVYALSVADIQTVARSELGRELDAGEIARIEDPLAERIDWHAAVAEAICDRIR